MSWEFKPGMKVVCIKDSKPRPSVNEIQVKVDQIYTIRSIMPCPSGSGLIGLMFEEIINPPQKYINYFGEALYYSKLFRPLQTQFSSLLNSIVSGVNDGKLVVEDTEYLEKRASKKRPVKASVEDEKYIEKFKKSQRKKVS